MRKDVPKIHQIIAQTIDGTTVVFTTNEVTSEGAVALAEKEKLDGIKYRPFIIKPICTEELWKNGHINFCPRCGAHLSEYDDDDFANDQMYGECPDCDATLDIHVTVPLVDEEEEETDEDE